ncbi:hypothetical protein [Streptomyces sp. AC495_CC817]|uniref:hypothetical protein n=1 Tax=Streptomyces sp. AC495_CC817 TaxID=2823900 RepID=UPI001C27C2A7|nr:hypothetical protein [Streptomyces sp. AC495_CC817]
MDDDRLTSILDTSAPTARVLDAGIVRRMILDAETMARPARARRRARIGIAAAASLALVVGGGGVAIASGLVAWPSGFEDPDGSYAFTLPSGRACEVRLIVEDRTDPSEPSADDAATTALQESVASWLRGGALDRDLDLVAADAEAERILADQETDSGMTVLIGSDGWLTDAAVEPGRPDADDARAFAVDRAVHAAMTSHLIDAGFPEDTWTFSTEGGVRCAAG